LIEDLDADTFNGVTWTNQITGHGDNVAASAAIAKMPNAANGHDAVVLTGNLRLTGSNATAFASLINGDGMAYFAVVKPGTQRNTGQVDRNQIFGTIHEGGNFSGFTAGTDLVDEPYAMMRPDTTEYKAQTGVAEANTWIVLAGRLQSGTNGEKKSTVYINSASVKATAMFMIDGSSQVGALTVGAERTLGTEFWTGQIARILIYDGPMTDNDFATTGRALGERYGIATTF
jgi:hypothetical protein